MLNYSINGQNRFKSILLFYLLEAKQTVSQNVKPILFHQYLTPHENMLNEILRQQHF